MKKEHALELLDSYLSSLRYIKVIRDGIEMRAAGAVDVISGKDTHNYNVFVYLHKVDDSGCIMRVTIGEYAVIAAASILNSSIMTTC